MNQSQPLIPLTTGERFRQRRSELGLSLAEVSTALKFSERLLRDLEEDRELAVAPVYRNGYIRKYAGLLAIPENEIAETLAASGEEPCVRSVFTVPAPRNLADKWLRVTSYVLASLLIGTLAWQFTYEAVRLSQDEPAGREIPSKSGAVENREKTVAASVAPLGALHQEGVGNSDTAEQAWEAITRESLADGRSRLRISVSADSWVEITDDAGQELEMDLLRGGSDKDYIGQPPFKILIGRSAAVRLAIDGEELDLAAYTRDDVARFIWPADTQEQQ